MSRGFGGAGPLLVNQRRCGAHGRERLGKRCPKAETDGEWGKTPHSGCVVAPTSASGPWGASEPRDIVLVADKTQRWHWSVSGHLRAPRTSISLTETSSEALGITTLAFFECDSVGTAAMPTVCCPSTQRQWQPAVSPHPTATRCASARSVSPPVARAASSRSALADISSSIAEKGPYAQRYRRRNRDRRGAEQRLPSSLHPYTDRRRRTDLEGLMFR